MIGVQYTPSDTAERLAGQPTNNTLYGARGLNDNLQVGINYGGGVKWHFTDHFGFRLDARGYGRAIRPIICRAFRRERAYIFPRTRS